MRIRAIALSAVVLLLAAGCGDSEDEPTTTTMLSDSSTITDRVENIEVVTEAGDVVVVASATGRVQVERTMRFSSEEPPTTTEDLDGLTLTLRHSCSGRCIVDYRIQVPVAAGASVETASGEVNVSNITGAVSVDTQSGDVSLIGLAGAVTVTSASGQVTGAGLTTGTASVEATSGDVVLAFASVPVDVTIDSASGDVVLTVPRAPYTIEATSASGEVDVGMASEEGAQSSITVRVASGDVRITPT
jgi:hypothetical protein